MNDFTCIGKVTENPEMHKTASGLDFCYLVVSSNKPFPNTDGVIETEDFSFICWKNTAEDIIKMVKKDMLIQIKGRIVANNYRNDERFIYKTDLVAERVSVLS